MTKMILAAVLAVTAVPAFADNVRYKYHNHGSYGPTGRTIVVSCERGPWKEVIWDRPNAVFVDSLVAVGYDFSTASAIATRVCRDQNLVGRPGAMKSTMEQIFNDPQSHRRHNY